MPAYDALKVNVTIDNVLVTGWASGTMVTCAKNEARVIPYSGVKGEYAHSINNNSAGTITLTLQQQSPLNKVLQEYANEKVMFPVSVIDINTGGFKAGGLDCMILQEPANERGVEITGRAWAIHVFDYSCVESD